MMSDSACILSCTSHTWPGGGRDSAEAAEHAAGYEPNEERTAAEAMVAAAAESMAMAAEVTAGRHTLRTLSQGRRRRRCTS